MNYDEMIIHIENLNDDQGFDISALPHGSNLLCQLGKKAAEREDLFNRILPYYVNTRTVSYNPDNLETFIQETVEYTNTYLDFLRTINISFSHQQDFTSSIIPEMLCNIIGKIIQDRDATLEVSAQKKLTIECTFDIANGGIIHFKNKKVDVAAVQPSTLSLNGNTTEFPIPLIAIECKTNLDKNMLSGIEHSVTELKKTFPNCHYYVVTEYSDYDVKKVNYASSGIDEMYILRKQKRAEVRNNPNARKPIDYRLVYEIAQTLIANIDSMRNDQLGLTSRMLNGKLIGRNRNV